MRRGVVEGRADADTETGAYCAGWGSKIATCAACQQWGCGIGRPDRFESWPELKTTASAAPDEPPPGYEEVQQSSVADQLEESVRKEG